MSEDYDEPVKLPTEMDSEDPFIQISEFNMSLRQILTVVMAGAVWFISYKLLAGLFPLSSTFFAIILIWLPLTGLYAAFKKKDEVTYEEYLTWKLVYLFSIKKWLFKESEEYKEIDEFVDADWEEDDDDMYIKF